MGAFGLYEGRELLGVLMFAVSCSENVRGSVFGMEHVNTVAELHRLVLVDDTERFAESFMISRALTMLKQEKPHLRAVVSFADPTAGHIGTIYQATNALYYGQSKPETFYRDQDGRLRHRRQCGRNISIREAEQMGWKPERRLGKHRYCFFLGGPVEAKRARKHTILASEPYPKQAVTVNGFFQT